VRGHDSSINVVIRESAQQGGLSAREALVGGDQGLAAGPEGEGGGGEERV
jgi:hypothetical protein